VEQTTTRLLQSIIHFLMRIALIGAAGQLGTALTRTLTGDELIPLPHDAVEITNVASVRAALETHRPELVINTAAYNLVDKAEDEPERACAVNGLGARNVATACAAENVTLVHISSDYVFGLAGARTTPYLESDAPGPQSAYAVSKLAGEYFVRAICPRHFVVRTCGLYGRATSPGKGNFIETMLRLGRERGAVSVVDDQCCTPTSALDLARAIDRLIRTDRYGLYHATNGGSTTWCGLAAEAFRQAGLTVNVLPITTAQFNAKAQRPPYSVLDCGKLERAIGWALPRWQDALQEYLSERS
jgi:dTDP-4-dehydrorhamnose reductase